VIDVVPRVPTTKQPPIQRILDQTVGIPLVPAFSSNNQLSYTPLTHTLSGSLPMMPNFTGKNFKNYMPADLEPAPPPPKFIHQYPLISATIPSKSQGLSTNSRGEYLPSAMASGPKHGGLAKKGEMKSSILSNNTTGSNDNMLKKESSEKQKVKFSDTITVAVVPVSAKA
jgi:WD repeat-containing and planar cell polarity effector protein